jgi:hypothetical protein
MLAQAAAVCRSVRDKAVLRMTAVRDPDLAALLETTDPHSLQSQRRRIGLYRAAQAAIAAGLQGDVVEMGSHHGGGAGMLTPLLHADPDRAMHLFDRWGSLPEPSDVDGAFARLSYEIGVEILRSAKDPMLIAQELLLTKLRVPSDRVSFNRGWLADTLPGYAGKPIAFAHVDLDLYESTKTALAFLEDKLADRAIIVLDDWGPAWPGVARAYREWAAATRRKLALKPARYQAVVSVS